MEPKSTKKHTKYHVKKKHIFKHDFYRIFFVLASQKKAKIEVFSHLYPKRRFCKNHCFSQRKLLFFRFGASKNRPKFNAKMHLKKTSKKKKLENRILASILVLQNLQNRLKKRRKTKPVPRRYGNRPQIDGNQHGA